MWDITVEEDHSYAAHGFYNHNSSPNAQQIPKPGPANFHLRQAFVAHKGYRLLGGDQSQVELRMMAHNSGDKNLCAEYQKDELRWKLTNAGDPVPKGTPKSDLHTKTATDCNSTRDEAKGINFGMLYMMQAKKLANVLTTAAFDAYMDGRKASFDPLCDTVSVQQAQEYITNYFNTFAGVKSYQEYCCELIKRQGWIATRFGRIRRLPEAFSSDKYQQLCACRTGLNHTVQGAVAELMLLSMLKVENVIPNPDGEALQKLGYRMFAQIHDELLGECPDNDQVAQDCSYHLVRIMQNPMPCTDAFPFAGYRVPLLFEAKSGPSWNKVH